MKENKNNNKKEDSMLLAQCSIFLKKDGKMGRINIKSKINKKVSKENYELIKEKFNEVGEILSEEVGKKVIDVDLKELKEILEEALEKMLK